MRCRAAPFSNLPTAVSYRSICVHSPAPMSRVLQRYYFLPHGKRFRRSVTHPLSLCYGLSIIIKKGKALYLVMSLVRKKYFVLSRLFTNHPHLKKSGPKSSLLRSALSIFIYRDLVLSGVLFSAPPKPVSSAFMPFWSEGRHRLPLQPDDRLP